MAGLDASAVLEEYSENKGKLDMLSRNIKVAPMQVPLSIWQGVPVRAAS